MGYFNYPQISVAVQMFHTAAYNIIFSSCNACQMTRNSKGSGLNGFGQTI